MPAKTPRQIADEGLDFHVSQKMPDVSTIFRTNENYDGHHCEWWGLYASTVGPDTIVDRFSIGDTPYEYEGWARGDFFENVPEPFTFPLTLALGAVGVMASRQRRRQGEAATAPAHVS